MRPWLVGEAGVYRAQARFQSLLFSYSHVERTANGGGLNLGGGFDVPLGRLVSLGVDARWNQTLHVFNDPHFVTTMANVSFHFGGSPAPPDGPRIQR